MSMYPPQMQMMQNQPMMQPQMYAPQYMPQPQYAQQQSQMPGMQPQMMQMQQMQQNQNDPYGLIAGLVKHIMSLANLNVVTRHMCTTFSSNNWQNRSFQGMVRLADAILKAHCARAPGVNPTQVVPQTVTDTYDTCAILELNTPVLQQQAQSAPDVINKLVMNIPALQQLVDIATSMSGLQRIPLQVPGYAPQVYQPQMAPTPVYNQGYGTYPGYAPQQMQMPGMQPQLQGMYGNTMQPTPMQSNGAMYGNQPTPESAFGSHARVQGAPVTRANVGKVTRANITSPVVAQPAQQQQPAPAQQQPQQQEARPIQTWSTPQLQQQLIDESNRVNVTPEEAQRIYKQAAAKTMQPLFNPMAVLNGPGETFGHESDIDFSKYGSEDADLFTAPDDEQDIGPVPSYDEIFNPNPRRSMDEVEASYNKIFGGDSSCPTTPEKDPMDGWMFTESTPMDSLEVFYYKMLKAKRNPKEPLPLSYDTRFCTRLYRYKDDGSIEQKVVGVPMDILKHDLSMIDVAPNPEKMLTEENFAPLRVTNVKDAVAVIKENEDNKEVIEEKLGESDIFAMDRPIIACSRQEAVIIAAARADTIVENNPAAHGYEQYVREVTMVTSCPDTSAYMANPLIAKLTTESDVPNMLELADTIRGIRAEGLMRDIALRKITEHMRRVINDMLTYDFGFAGTFLLDDDQPFEDELTDFIVYIGETEEYTDILERIHANWGVYRARLCRLLTGSRLANAQQVLARRYADNDSKLEATLKVTKGAIILERGYSITTLNKRTTDLGINKEATIFPVQATLRPYLHKAMQDITKRGAQRVSAPEHYIVTRDGVELSFVRGGLGDGSTFIAHFTK